MKHAPDVLKKAGLKVTPVRRDMLNIFLIAATPLSVDDIRTTLITQGAAADKVTAYRTINTLCEAGLIRRVDFGEGRSRYERTDLPHHHHLVCESCGVVNDTTLCLDDTKLQRITNESGFAIASHSLDFYGTCASCQQQSLP